jgi:hypothetical protein
MVTLVAVFHCNYWILKVAPIFLPPHKFELPPCCYHDRKKYIHSVISLLHILNDLSFSLPFFKQPPPPPTGPLIDSCVQFAVIYLQPVDPPARPVTFWFSAPRLHCSTPASCWFLAWFSFCPENDGSALLRNACGVLPDYTVLHSKR